MIDFFLRPFRRNFGKDKIFFRIIDDMFGFIPNNIELYKLALIHKSASITLDNGQHINNERLEFLGDAVIETITSDYLFIEFPDKSEGFLTQMRSKMVSRQSLNAVAKRLGLDDHVITNTSNHSSQKHIYGDAFEAMMGAIYLDQGYDFVNRLLINKIFVEHLKPSTLVEAETDFKSRLIEWCQKNHHTIQFNTAQDKTYSSSHPFFYSKVLIDNIEVGYGAGESKKEAEQRASFSVSQGFNDDDCNKLMDKLDTIESSKTKESKHKKETQPRAERAEKTENEGAKQGEAKQEPAPIEETLKDEPIKDEQPKEDKPKEEKPKAKKPRARKAKETEVKADSIQGEAISETSATEEKPQADKLQEVESQEQTPQETKAKPKRSTRARRTAKPKGEETPIVATETTDAKPKTESDNTNKSDKTIEDETKPKPRTRRRRTSKSATPSTDSVEAQPATPQEE